MLVDALGGPGMGQTEGLQSGLQIAANKRECRGRLCIGRPRGDAFGDSTQRSATEANERSEGWADRLAIHLEGGAVSLRVVRQRDELVGRLGLVVAVGSFTLLLQTAAS